MADIKTITLPNSSTYNIKDASALATLSISGNVLTGTTRGGVTVSVTLPTGADEKVKVSSSTTDANFPLIAVATSSITSGNTYQAIYDSGIVINPYKHSIAEGASITTASGFYSHAEGQTAVASGNYSHAEGYNNLANGLASHVEGLLSTASGTASHAEGYLTIASGYASHAEGYYTTASGTASHTNGKYTIANQDSMTAIGKYNSTVSANMLFAVGNGTANTARSNILEATTTNVSINGTLSVTNINGSAVGANPKFTDTTYSVTVSGTGNALTTISLSGTTISAALGSFMTSPTNSPTSYSVLYTPDGTNNTWSSYGFMPTNSPTTNSIMFYNGSSNVWSSYSIMPTNSPTTNSIMYYNGSDNVWTSYSFMPTNSPSANNVLMYNGSGAVWDSISLNDEKVKVSTSTTNAKFPLMAVATSSATSGNTYQAIYDSGIVINPNKHSVAEGYVTTATGSFSHAEGYNTTASGTCSHVEGQQTNASGTASHAEGIGSTASGAYSHAEGYYTRATGNRSHAEGESTTASGTASHAEGILTVASGTSSHTEGSTCSASGNSAHAEGRLTLASGYISHAEGYNTKATSDYSHSEGFTTTASGIASHAGGIGTIANVLQVMAIGRYNSTCSAGDLFVIGNGTSATSLKTVFKVSDSNGSINGGGNAIVNVTGRINAIDGFFQTSDKRKKNIISDLPLDKVYDLIDKCQTIIYTLKDDESNKEQIGMIALEIQEFFPEVISEDKEGMLSLDYSRLTVIIFKVLKDLIKRIEKLEQKLN